MEGTQTSREATGCANTGENSDSPVRRMVRRYVQTNILTIENIEDDGLTGKMGLELQVLYRVIRTA